ncbi:hypothetical protein [Bacillus sp. MB2021]|uniref:hypothetical protein n=1 Tax=Bacillus sp. MB2021 TaxID=1408303 RepID=UPI0004E0DC37|nr:hypothetical protein [Bacillus sp. MB2021]
MEEFVVFLVVSGSSSMFVFYVVSIALVELVTFFAELGFFVYVIREVRDALVSFIDLGMVLSVARAEEDGTSTLIFVCTGDISFAVVVYAARAVIGFIVVVLEGVVVFGYLAPAFMSGVVIFAIGLVFVLAFPIFLEIFDGVRVVLVYFVNPSGLFVPEGSVF